MKKNSKYFKYNNQTLLLMKKEEIGTKITILFFICDEKYNVKNNHVQFMTLSKEEYSKIDWITQPV